MDKQKISKRNFIFMTMEGSFLFFGLTFIDGNTVIPLFVHTFTGSLGLAGLATTLRMFFMILTQCLAGPYVSRIKNIPSFLFIIMIIARPLILVMVPLLLIDINSNSVVLIFLIVYSLFFISEGILGISWWDLFSRTISHKKRGKLLGYQLFFSGIAGIVGGIVIKIILESTTLTIPHKYAIIFSIAGVLLFISALTMLPLRDFPREVSTEKVKLLKYFKKLPSYFSINNNFKKLCSVQIATNFATMALPFLLLFSKDTFHLEGKITSSLVLMQIIGTLIGGIIWGSISHRWGNKFVLIFTQIILVLVYFIALISKVFDISSMVYLIMLLGGISAGSWIGIMGYLMDIIDAHLRTTYLVLFSIISFPFTFLFYIAGLIAETWGFEILFIISLLASLFALIYSFRLKAVEPQDIII